MLGAGLHRASNLASEPTAQITGAGIKISAVQPCRAGRDNLALQIHVGTHGQSGSRPAFPIFILPQFHNCAGLGIPSSFYVSKLDMMCPSVDPIDNGIGTAG